MAIKESDANTLVRFRGMGLINFSEENPHGDIMIIRDKKHTFSVRVQEPRFKDGAEKDVIVYEDIAVYDSLPPEGVGIEIQARNESETSSYETYEAEGEFDRLKSEDVNDFRWIVDLEDLHTNKLAKIESGDQYPITNLSIKNGFFYTHKLDTDLFFEKITKNADGNEENREVFGHVAETIGVRLDAKKVKFRIKIGEEETIHKLKKVKGLPYRIEINNVDYNDDSEISDMPEYYEYLASQSGRTFELEPVKDEDGNLVSGGSVNDFVFCHPGKGGGGCSC